MPRTKAKTHKGLAKRLKLTGKGKVAYNKMGKSHFLRNKTAARKRRMRKKGILSGTIATKMRKGLSTYKGARR
jgi:large subunit ribosomal protein L35